MTTRTSTKVVMSAAIVMGWTWLTALQCSEGTGPVVIQDCHIPVFDSDFPLDANLSLNKPARCPIGILGYTQGVPYAATADLPASNVTYGFYRSDVIGWRGNWGGSVFGNPVWSQGSNGRYVVQISGTYSAGFDGPRSSDNMGWDSVKSEFYINNNHWSSAISVITYQWGLAPSNSIAAPGPGYVDPYTSYSVSATTNDPVLISPVTWSWYADGSLVGTTTDPQFTVTAGGPSTQQQLEVVATDGNGHSVSGLTTVWVNCGAQLWQNNVAYHEEDIVCYGQQQWQSTLEANIGYVPYDGSPYWTLVQ